MTESQLSLSIRKALDKMGIPNYRMQSFGYRGRMRGLPKNTPDILALPQIGDYELPMPVPFWIEVKRPGEKPTSGQLEFGDRARKRGEFWCVAESLDDVLRELKEVNAR